jgi:hypothetical protein
LAASAALLRQAQAAKKTTGLPGLLNPPNSGYAILAVTRPFYEENLRMKRLLIGLALVLSVGSIALAQSGGGGGGNGGGGSAGSVAQVGGTWHGYISTPAVQFAQGVMTLFEDASGNMSGDLNMGPSFQILPLQGRAKNGGTFQLKTQTMTLNGSVLGSTTCVDGSTGEVIGGSVQIRGGVGSFLFNNCAAQ